LSLNRVKAVTSGDVVEGVADINATDVSISCEAKVEGVDLMGPEDANGIRPDEEIIAIEFDTGLIVVVVEAELCGIAGEEKVLSEVVKDEGILVAIVKGIEEAVGFLFGLIKPNDVELIAVGEPSAEEPYGAVGISEDESSKVTYKRLRSGANGKEVIIRTEVGEFCFDEPFFECGVESGSGGTTANVGVDHGEFIHVEVVEIEDWG
jgi:hypothetical protein